MEDDQRQVRVLTLTLDHDGSSTVYKLRKGWTLQFRLGPSVLGRNVDLFTNYPAKDQPGFDRCTYQQLGWQRDSANEEDDTAIYHDLHIATSGSFHFFITDDSGKERGNGYFCVEPTLTVGKDGEEEDLPMNCIQSQTVLTKNLGPFKHWQDKLMVAKETGYNMVHFTPVHALGASDSCYCLSDQHELDPRYQCTWSEMQQFVKFMKEDWKMLTICDIVLNHSANESKWIQEHSECTYNCHNSPHLRPAFLMDRMLEKVTLDIESGRWVEQGIPKGEVSSVNHLNIIEKLIHEAYIPEVKFQEFFILDIPTIMQQYQQGSEDNQTDKTELEIILDPQRRRLRASIDFGLARKMYSNDANGLKLKLEELNNKALEQTNDHVRSAVSNIISGAKYERVDPKGLLYVECGLKRPARPLIRQYFTCSHSYKSLEEQEAMMYDEKEGKTFMVHNGWVMGMDPSVDFASAVSQVYLRRELVAWGDSVKLNYGQCPSDNPFLWDYMKKYVEQVATIYHGIRLDNCHSTPIHVAEYLLDAARKIRPDLYVIAELFTGSEATDNKYLNRLGINSLIREGLQAWNSKELGRLVYHYGGDVVGSFAQPSTQPLQPLRVAHAILYDQTHDNQSAIDKRTHVDPLPSSALALMASCAFGSNRGYDEMVPHHIHVVKEQRYYASWQDLDVDKMGIVKAKRALLDLHAQLGREGFNEVYVDQMSPDVVAITRHSPKNHESVVLVAHTAFNKCVDVHRCHTGLHLNVEGQLKEVVLEARLKKTGKDREFEEDNKVINGLDNYLASCQTHFSIDKSDMVSLKDSGEDHGGTMIELDNFPPGSVVCFRFQLNPDQIGACLNLQNLLSHPGQLKDCIGQMKLRDVNHALFKCNAEELDESHGKCGVYVLDGYGPLCYAGLQGVVSILAEIRPKNDLGNWLPGNLRSGDWMLDYISHRLKKHVGTKQLGVWFEQVAFKQLKHVPRYLIPRYFDIIVSMVYCLLLERMWSQMSPLVQNGSSFTRALAMGSVQHGAVIKSARLPPIMSTPAEEMVSLAAGLPHFSTGYMRNWGRDTFIALRGLFILTGRHEEAKNVILAFAACLRHGLIPNLLDGGVKARFNCRDAIWWWLHCIKSFVQDVGSADILKAPVSRIFPTDDSEPRPLGHTVQPLEDVIQEALQKHFQGLKFRERNAGTAIDEHMTDAGFNNEIGVDLETGFVFGGNIHNCGTWMDKMGSSCEAGIKGKPATPRDGSAVELVGLSFACIKWLSDLHAQGKYAHGSVSRKDPLCGTNHEISWTFQEWSDKIKSHFDASFFVPNKESQKRPDLVNKVGIYKDTLNSGLPWTDFQLRCNFAITMTVAPELFNPNNAWTALLVAKDKLLGPLGMATLDPDDWSYRGVYDNDNRSHDNKVAHGFNYHQGPEWLWPVGFYLRAYLTFAAKLNKWREAKGEVMAVMSRHFTHVQISHWRGLPELTNGKGEHCRHSNPIQAWSMACLLEVLHDIEKGAICNVP